MLGKLLKYEFKSTARIFLPLYPALLIVAILNKVMYSLFDRPTSFGSIPKILTSTVYFVILVGIIVLTFLVMIQRFYKNLMGDEGYLMFTLPVKSSLLIFSKLIAAVVWSIASTFIAIISVIILLPDYGFIFEIPGNIIMLNRELIFNYGIGFWPLAIVFVLLMLAALVFSVLMIYVSIAIGHLIGRHKLAGSFAAYLIVSTITQAIVMICSATFGIANHNFLLRIDTYSNLPMLVLISFLIMFAFLALMSFIYFYVTQKILDTKLNLE